MTRKIMLPNMKNGSSCLVPVYIKLVTKGSLKRHALICLPELRDLAVIKTLFEPHHQDPNESIRKDKRSEHKKLLKKLKHKRNKLKKKNVLVSLLTTHFFKFSILILKRNSKIIKW